MNDLPDECKPYTKEVIVNKCSLSAIVNSESAGTAKVNTQFGAENETVTFTATPKTGYKFVNWTDASSGGVVSANSSFNKKITSSDINKSYEYKANFAFDNNPGNFTANVSANSITASWDAVTGATGYELYVSKDSNFSSYVSGYGPLSTTNLSETLADLDANTDYYIRVRAKNDDELFSDFVNTSAKTGLKVRSASLTMAGYTYAQEGDVPQPQVMISPTEENPTFKCYYNTSNSSSGGEEWMGTSVTSTTLLAGNYYMYAVVDGTESFSGCTTTPVPFSVSKAECVISELPTATYTYGEKLSAHNPIGGQANVDGTFTWDTSVENIVPQVSDSQNMEYDLIFTPDDTTNYAVKSCKTKVTVLQRSAEQVTAKVSFDYQNNTFTVTETLTDDLDNILISGSDYERLPIVSKDFEKYTEFIVTYELKGNYSGQITKKFTVSKPKTDDPGKHDGDRIVTRVDKEGDVDSTFNPSLDSLSYTEAKKIIAEDIISDNTSSYEAKAAATELADGGDNVVCDADMYIKISEQEDVSEDTRTLIREELRTVKDLDSNVAYLDISMFTKYTLKNATTGDTIVESGERRITDTGDEPEDEIEITINVPNELKCQKANVRRTYYVVRAHETTTGIVTDTLARTTEYKITFRSSKFSTYGLLYSDELIPSPKPTPSEEPKNSGLPWLLRLIKGSGGNNNESNDSQVAETIESTVAPAYSSNTTVVVPGNLSTGFVSPKTGDTSEVFILMGMLMLGLILIFIGMKPATYSKENKQQ